VNDAGFQLQVAQEAGVLRFTVTGRQSPANDVAIDAAVRAHCERLGIRLAMIDIRGLRGRLSLLANHEAARTLRERLGAAVLAVAIVDLPQYREESEMFELTSTNRGAILRVFECVDEAAGWLAGIAAAAGGSTPG